MAVARSTLVAVTALCCLSVSLSRPHEKKHKHRLRGQIEVPLVLDESGENVVISDANKELFHHTDNAESFDILSPNSAKEGNPPDVKKAPQNVFLDHQEVSFDKQTDTKKDEQWRNLYEIKGPVDDKSQNINAGVSNAQNLPINNHESHQIKGIAENTDKNNGGEESEEDEDGIEDDYDDDGDYYDYDEYEEEKDGIFEDQSKGKKEETQVKGTKQVIPEKKDSAVPEKKDFNEKTETFEELVNEVYGGVLPYSVSIENINKQLTESKEKSKNKAPKEVNKPTPSAVKETDKNVIELSDHVEIPFHQDMLETVEELHMSKNSKDENTKPTTKSIKTDVPSTTTTEKPLPTTTTITIQNSRFVNEPKNENEQSKINASFKTPNVAETSPNPPTTKAVSVTAAPISGVKEYIQSKPLQLCMDNGGCSPGRMCHNGVCVCGEASLCHRGVSVCGSDGQLYPSHCELHRQACLKQIHIRVNHNGLCGQDIHQQFKIQPIYEGTQCEYSKFINQEGILWGDLLVPVQVKSLLECSDLCDKKSVNGGCFAFQFSKEKSGQCYLFEKPTDIIRHPNPEMDFYEQRRCKPNTDTECDYEPVNLVAEHVYAMCNVKTYTDKTYDECQDTCQNCTAFTYRKEEKKCEVHRSKACIDMMNALGMVHYIKRCNEKGDICHVLEVIPGKSPFMCSKASSSVSSLIECHDACVHGRCEAFQYLTREDGTTTCEIFFDKSCIDLLDKKKENYYVKRCTNPKDCNYHKIQSASMLPCRVTSSDMDTMEKCRNMCNVDSCYGFHYDYDSLKCDLYSEQSCVLGKNLNFVVRKCHDKKAVLKNMIASTWSEIPTAKPQVQENSPSTTKPPVTAPSTTTKSPLLSNNLPDKKDDVFCHEDNYRQFKTDLLRYHCVRFRENHCDEKHITNKGYIASLMFSYYDRDMNGEISNDELWEMQVAENLEHLSTRCTLLDLLARETKDDKLNKPSFLNAFTMKESVDEEEVTVVPVTSTAENGLEIKCGVPMIDGSEIVWRRNGVDLTSLMIPDMAVFSDGTLYFEAVGLHHVGNFTCNDKAKPGVKEIHQLLVNVKPKVHVSPTSLTMEMNHMDLYIDCHVDGIPPPRVIWNVNGQPLSDNPKHYITTHNNGTLMIQNTDFERDVGKYRCSATNQAGSNYAEAVIDKLGSPKKKKEEAFYIFHKDGYTAYEPSGCETLRHVHGDFGNLKYIPEELDLAPSMCGIGQECVWGEAVNVQNKYIYASQPQHNRIIVIDIGNTFNPIQIVKTDKYPVKLYYVEHLDEVWILCWNADHDSGSKTVVVIRDASKDIRHHIVHTQPIGYRFDLVEDIFIPPQNDLDHKFKYGYVSHSNQRGLFKIDLESMRYTKAIDLEKQDCVPKTLVFIPIGGYLVIECERQVQLVLDYITDTVVTTLSVTGTPYISPDSRHLLFVQKNTGIVTVYSITTDGQLLRMYEVTTGRPVSEATFFTSGVRSGYDVFLAGSEDETVYPLKLDNGQVTTIAGKNEVRSSPVWPWSRSSRMIASGDYFSHFLAAPSKSMAVILNGRDKSVHCSYPGLDSPDLIVYTATILQ